MRRLLAVTAVLLAVACSDEPEPGYDQAFQAEFVRACRASIPGEAGAAACGCWYERLQADVAFEDLPSLDELTAPAADEDSVDPALYEPLADCVRAAGAAVTVPATAPPPPTVPRPSTSTTTTVPAG